MISTVPTTLLAEIEQCIEQMESYIQCKPEARNPEQLVLATLHKIRESLQAQDILRDSPQLRDTW